MLQPATDPLAVAAGVGASVVGAGDGLRHFTESSFAESSDADRDYRLMANNLPILSWMANADGYIFWYNRHWYEYTGCSPTQLEGWGWRSVHDPETLPQVMSNWAEAVERGESFEMTFPLRAADGSFRPFLTRAQPVRNTDGKVTRWYGVNIDVSGAAALASRLSESETAMRAFFETAGVYTAVIEIDDRDFTFIVANRRMARFWGAESITGRSARSLRNGKLARGMMTALKRGHAAGEPTTTEYPFAGPDGERWFTATLTPMPPGTSGRRRLSIASIDITARKRAEAALATAVETKDMLLHEVNHRVKNSLQLVTALLSLQAAQAVDPVLRASLVEARGRVSVVASMHQRLYSTSAHDRVDIVAYLCELAEESVSALNAGGRVVLDFAATDEIVLPLSQAVPLALVVSELITNAMKYAYPGDVAGIIRLHLSRTEQGDVRVFVGDTGPGLPEGFSLLRSGSLGMKIVRSLTRQLQAVVNLCPQNPGAGFEIVVPREAA